MVWRTQTISERMVALPIFPAKSGKKSDLISIWKINNYIFQIIWKYWKWKALGFCVFEIWAKKWSKILPILSNLIAFGILIRQIVLVQFDGWYLSNNDGFINIWLSYEPNKALMPIFCQTFLGHFWRENLRGDHTSIRPLMVWAVKNHKVCHWVSWYLEIMSS